MTILDDDAGRGDVGLLSGELPGANEGSKRQLYTMKVPMIDFRAKGSKVRGVVVLEILLSGFVFWGFQTLIAAQPALQAGAASVDISPGHFPVEINGGFTARFAEENRDQLHARALVLDNGQIRLGIVIVDSLMLTRELLDQTKRVAQVRTGIPSDRLLIAATHTHSAPSAMGCLGTEPDPLYSKFLRRQIILSLEKALANLTPARVGWTVADATGFTYCRRWILRPDRLQPDPFGQLTVRAMMHPGHLNPDYLAPSGPVDTDLSLLSVQSREGSPIALLANFSMHYFGTEPSSADYFGRFAGRMEELLSTAGSAPVVAMMSQGTSGDLQWRNYGEAEVQIDLPTYTEGLVQIAHKAYQAIRYQDWVPLAMAESKIKLERRLPDAKRLDWALKLMDAMKDRRPQIGQRTRGSGGKGLEEIYAREQVLLLEEPVRELKLQAIRIGDLGITAIPNEVYSLTGLKLKKMSPLKPTFNIELANGAEGYIPPPEQHKLGGYTTWPARTAGLEVAAEPKIVEAVLRLLEQVSGNPRFPVSDPLTSYGQAVQKSEPIAYWQLGEIQGAVAADLLGNHPARFGDGIALYLDGTPIRESAGLNKAPRLAGGSIHADIPEVGDRYSIEMWFYNDLSVEARGLTGVLFWRGNSQMGDLLALGGSATAPGRLVLGSGDLSRAYSIGRTRIEEKTWNHVVLVRDEERITVYLNGSTDPDVEIEATSFKGASAIVIGGSRQHSESFEGKIDEVSFYDRALSIAEITDHYKLAGTIPTAR